MQVSIGIKICILRIIPSFVIDVGDRSSDVNPSSHPSGPKLRKRKREDEV